jgi:hypothetical protein
VKLRGVSLEYREHEDGSSAFLVFHSGNNIEEVLEWDFVLDALRLRNSDVDGFEFAWSLVDLLVDRGPPVEALES